MRTANIFGILLLFSVWVVLCYFMLRAGRFNLKNFFVIVASGIVIFVPLWKKYISSNGKNKSNKS